MMSFSLAPLAIQFPALATSSSASNLKEHRKLPSLNHQIEKTKDFVGICLRTAKSCSGTRRRVCCKSQLAELAPVSSAAYGVLLLSGGLFAFAKSGSKGSLFGGITGASLMASFLCAISGCLGQAYFLMQASETKAIGDALGFGSAFLFSSIFGIRLAATRKLVPAGPLLGLSICALVVFTSAYLQDRL